MKAKPRLNSLNGLKVIAVLMIFRQHCAPYNTPIPDQAARAVEFFFIVSGFLMAYNHYDTDVPVTWKSSFYFAMRRIAKIWPLHMITLLLFAVLIMGESVSGNIKNLILNVFLLQAWSAKAEVYFSFNGVSWFLSAIVFCYFMTPLLLSFVKKTKRVWMIFLSALIMRFLFSYFAFRFSDAVFYDVYSFPPSRCMEYLMGMTLFPLFECIKDANCSAKVYSFAEILTILLAVIVFKANNEYWHSVICILAICPGVLVFAKQKGLLSKILSSPPFEMFSKIQMEFFLFHATISCIMIKYCSFRTVAAYMICYFITVIVVSWIYHRFLYAPLGNSLMRVINNCEKKELKSKN